MVRRLRIFWRGLSANWIGTAGVVLTTSGFVLFLVFELLRLAKIVTNQYIGLISYLALPAVFVLGLLLIPAGWWLYKRRTGKNMAELLSERFEPEMIEPRPAGSRLVKMIFLLTLVNLLFLGAGGARMLHFMNQPEFCGTACHSVMGPEWAAYQESPHARVRCIDCHVGEGLEAELDAKLNGVWQMISITFDLYERPIPTPVHNLRPARETCEKCHWPQIFYGQRMKRIVRHADDRRSTPRYTTLLLKVGSPARSAGPQIHWHVADQNQVRYQSHDDSRMEIRWAEVRRPNGKKVRYENIALRDRPQPDGRPPVRTMDCVDCHNRATHIFEDPERAVDRLIESGEIVRELPFIKRQALAALTGNYPPGAAAEHIGRDLRAYYQREHPGVFSREQRQIDAVAQVLKNAYTQNVHERMNVTWNAYPDHIGHRLGPGCRRCHNPQMVTSEGKQIGTDCTMCHSILAWDSPGPYSFLMPPEPGNPECEMHLFLAREFLKYLPPGAGFECSGRQ